MLRALPAVGSPEEFHRIARDEAVLRPGAEALCAELGLTLGARFAEGSLPLHALEGNLALKLYPPVYDEERVREVAMLETLAGRLPIATPAVERSGTSGGWAYVVMSRLPGEPLSRMWTSVPVAEHERLAEELGGALHTEIMREHVLVQASPRAPGFRAVAPLALGLRLRPGGARATNGLNLGRTSRNVDGQCARVGEGSAEFTSAEGGGACRSQGTRCGAFVPASRLRTTPPLSNFPWYIQRLALRPEIRTLEEIAVEWWGAS